MSSSKIEDRIPTTAGWLYGFWKICGSIAISPERRHTGYFPGARQEPLTHKVLIWLNTFAATFTDAFQPERNSKQQDFYDNFW